MSSHKGLDEPMEVIGSSPPQSREIEDLRVRLEEAEAVLRAIRNGEVDGVMVSAPGGDFVQMLPGAEQSYRLFVEEMSEGALTLTAEGLVLFCNRRFAEFLGLSRDALVGRRIDSIPVAAVRTCLATLLADTAGEPEPEEAIYAADGAVRILNLLANRTAGAGNLAVLVTDVTKPRAREAELRHSKEEMEDGVRERTRALANTVDELRRSRRAALNMMEDATAAAEMLASVNRALEEQIEETIRAQEAQRRLSIVVEQAAETIVITDLDGTIVYVNPAFERISGYTAEEAIGLNSRILSSGRQTAEFYQQLWSTIGAGRVWQGHFTNRRKDGTLYDEEATISPVRDAAGTITNYVALKRDVSAEIALEEQLRHAQKIEAIGTLAGGVAHDFNNLLQAMLSVVQLLKRKSTEPRDVAHLTQLEKTIRRGSSLTQQLLLFARRETSKRATLDLNQILRDLLDFFHRVAPANIRLSVEPASAPCLISADRGQIEQVIMNLAVNAIDAMPAGGALSIRTGCDHQTGWLTASDTGTGIPQAIRDRIFEPFFTTKEAGKGTGLGLSVVYGIVTAHGGTIRVDCPEEGGTVFRVELPVHSVAASLPPPLEEEVLSGRGERVLLVEDDPAAREGLAGILEILGYAVVAVGSGEEAVGIDTPAPFSVLLTDFMLPGIPGLQVVRLLHKRWPGIKAILMSGYAPQATVAAASEAKEIRFLQKPFDMAALARTLSDALHPSGNPDRP